MIVSASAPTTARLDEVAWRSTQPGLWVARRGDRHLGTVERGRRYVATGQDGEPLGAFGTLEKAKQAVATPDARPLGRPVRERPWGAVAVVATIVVIAAMVLLAYAFLLV